MFAFAYCAISALPLLAVARPDQCGVQCPDNSLCDVGLKLCRVACGRSICAPGDVCDDETALCKQDIGCVGNCTAACAPVDGPCALDVSEHPPKRLDYFLVTLATMLLVATGISVLGIYLCCKSKQPNIKKKAGFHQVKAKFSPIKKEDRSNPRQQQDVPNGVVQLSRSPSLTSQGDAGLTRSTSQTSQRDAELIGSQSDVLSPIKMQNGSEQLCVPAMRAGSHTHASDPCTSNELSPLLPTVGDPSPIPHWESTSDIASRGSTDSGLSMEEIGRIDNETARKQLLGSGKSLNETEMKYIHGSSCPNKACPKEPASVEFRSTSHIGNLEEQRALEFDSSSGSSRWSCEDNLCSSAQETEGKMFLAEQDKFESDSQNQMLRGMDVEVSTLYQSQGDNTQGAVNSSSVYGSNSSLEDECEFVAVDIPKDVEY